MLSYPDIYFTSEYQELFKDTAFGGAPCHFESAGIDYRFYKRPIKGTPYFDIVSPYGYSGPLPLSDFSPHIFLSSFHAFCESENIIAEFARLHPFIENQKWLEHEHLKYEHDTFYINLTQTENDIWKGFDKGCKSTIKWGHQHVGAVTIGKVTDRWWELYSQTMERCDATERYYFASEFFNNAQVLLDAHIKLFQAWDYDEVVASSLILRFGDYAHYFLSASDKDKGKNRMNLILWQAIEWAKSQGCKIFNLGGGLKAGDSLESFKRSFTKTSRPFYTYRKIHNQEVYNQLCQDRGIDPKSDGFFPAYRRA